MNECLDNLVEKVGNNGTYQKRLLLIIFLLWISFEILAISLPFLEQNRKISFYDLNQKEFVNKTLNYTLCETYTNNTNQTIELSGHSWTIEFGIECDKLKVGLISSFFFVGILIGSILIQIIPDIIGRKLTPIFVKHSGPPHNSYGDLICFNFEKLTIIVFIVLSHTWPYLRPS